MGGINWETGIDTYTLLCIKQVTKENLPYSTELYSVLCIRVADSLCWTAETNNIVKQINSNDKKKVMEDWETDALSLPQIYRMGGTAVHAPILLMKEGP